jgi:hypothetical protein
MIRVRIPVGAWNSFLRHHVQTGFGPTQPAIKLIAGASSLGCRGRSVKLTTHLHLVPRSKNAWIYNFTPQYVFMAWCLVKIRNNFILPYLINNNIVQGIIEILTGTFC